MAEQTEPKQHFVEKCKDYLRDYHKYMIPKISAATLIGGVLGASIGHINTGNPIRFMAIGGFGLGVMHTAYSTSTYLMIKNGMNEDASHSISGALTLCWGATYRTKSVRNALLGLAFGSLLGFAYKQSGDYLYSTSREAWLLSRAKTIQTSPYKVVTKSRPNLIPWNEAGKVKANDDSNKKDASILEKFSEKE